MNSAAGGGDWERRCVYPQLSAPFGLAVGCFILAMRSQVLSDKCLLQVSGTASSPDFLRPSGAVRALRFFAARFYMQRMLQALSHLCAIFIFNSLSKILMCYPLPTQALPGDLNCRPAHRVGQFTVFVLPHASLVGAASQKH